MDNVINQETVLKERIQYDEKIFGSEQIYNQIIKDLLEDSKQIALSVIYPFDDYFEKELPKKYNNWQIRCCIELYNLADKSIFNSYTENGWSFTKKTDGLSDFLMGQIMPKIGIIKSSVVEEETLPPEEEIIPPEEGTI